MPVLGANGAEQFMTELLAIWTQTDPAAPAEQRSSNPLADDDIVFYDPDGVFTGHAEIESFSDSLQQRFPGQHLRGGGRAVCRRRCAADVLAFRPRERHGLRSHLRRQGQDALRLPVRDPSEQHRMREPDQVGWSPKSRACRRPRRRARCGLVGTQPGQGVGAEGEGGGRVDVGPDEVAVRRRSPRRRGGGVARCGRRRCGRRGGRARRWRRRRCGPGRRPRRLVGSCGSSMPIRQAARVGGRGAADHVAAGGEAEVGVGQRVEGAGGAVAPPTPSPRRSGRGRTGPSASGRRTSKAPSDSSRARSPSVEHLARPRAGSRRGRARRGRAGRRPSRRGRC